MAHSWLLLALLVPTHASVQGDAASAAMNPIRKVVSMLQAMQKKVEEEGEKETELHKKFMCYCKTSGGTLSDSIAANSAKSSALVVDIKTAEEEKAGAEEALKSAQDDRQSAKDSIAEATGIREKEAKAYAAEKGSYDSNINAIYAAIAALEKGVAGAFLQTDMAHLLRKLILSKQDMLDVDREDILSFLSGGQGSEYVPQSGQIIGILKQMADEMAKGLAEATATENRAIKDYEALMAAKKKEVLALTATIETKLNRLGDLGVSIAQMKNELTDTEEALLADKEFLANLEKNCATRVAEWECTLKVRAEELVALAETIKVLNDDDALDLFKKTLPSASSSLLQVREASSSTRALALAALKQAIQKSRPDHARIDFIALALRGQKIGFDKVIEMIDKLIALLKKEQTDDDNKYEYCSTQFDLADDKKKALERAVSDLETAIASAADGIATLKEEIAGLVTGIGALDKSVAEATMQRRQEYEDFNALIASDSAAKQLLGFAKNRLNKFYNPAMYKAPPKVELSAEDRTFVGSGGTPPPTEAPGGIAGTGIAVLAQVAAHVQHTDAPPPPPETSGKCAAYSKKSAEKTGVIGMIDLLVTDLETEIAEATATEKDAQSDYEVLMQDSAAKRAADSRLVTEKNAAKAGLEGDLEAYKESHASTTKELKATMQYIAELHAECDWLSQYYHVRKDARASEIDALQRAKAVLLGADYSLLQTESRGHLRRVA